MPRYVRRAVRLDRYEDDLVGSVVVNAPVVCDVGSVDTGLVDASGVRIFRLGDAVGFSIGDRLVKNRVARVGR